MGINATEEEKREILEEVLGKREEETDSVVEDEEVQDDDAIDETDLDSEEEDSGEVDDEHELDPDIVQRAQQYGYTPEMLSAFSSTEQLEAALAAFDRLTLSHQQQQRQQQQQQQPPKKDELEELLGSFDEESPERKAIEGLLKRTQTMESYLQQFAAVEQQRQFQEVHDRFSSALDGLKTDLYGDGVKVSKEQRAARDEAEQMAWGLLQVELQRGNYQADFSEVLRRAANAVHSAQLSKERNKTTAEKIKNRSARRTNVGTRKRTGKTTLTPEQKREYDRKPSRNPEFMQEVHDIINRKLG